ncbi:MAG: HD-GYP domain-containing protein, partial [Clostridiaceae bacterium]|nr:HD-GYP domain-containing protein [Clostridiaceae bacterium]
VYENIPSSDIPDEDAFLKRVDSPAMIETKKEYTIKIEKIKGIFNNLAEGNSFDEDAREVVSSIIESDKFSGDFLRCMRQLRDTNDYTYQHSLNVSSLCYLIGSWMKLTQDKLEELTLAGLVHDIGKSKISSKILNKTSALTKTEMLEIKKHPGFGYQILKNNTSYSESILNAVLMHHEREDGTGYPSNLKGKDIHFYAKIIAVANLYSSVTLDRIYKKTDTPFSVFEIFESASSQKFDPLVVYTLISNIANYYIGDKVRLTNGKLGQIVFFDPEFISRPIIHCQDGTTIDLKTEKNIKITEIFT